MLNTSIALGIPEAYNSPVSGIDRDNRNDEGRVKIAPQFLDEALKALESSDKTLSIIHSSEMFNVWVFK